MNFNIVHKIKSKLQLLPTFILMLLMLSLFSTGCNEKPRYQVGNIIEFGSYYQDDLSRKTPIKWRILDIKDGKAFLISELLLDAQPYNKERKEITWENSSIRHWLNNEFINEAFNSQEKSRISLTLLDNCDNPEYGTNAGNDTKDKVFLLSLDDVYKYLPNENQLAIKVTTYAKKRGAYYKKNDGNGVWWLRSPGNRQDHAAVVLSSGIVYYGDGYTVRNNDIAVRPALFINL